MGEMETGASNGTNHERLNGWKEIASFLGRGVRTAQRWEKELGLPVRRIHTGGGEVVFAMRGELDTWLAKSETQSSLTADRDEHDVRNGNKEVLNSGNAGAISEQGNGWKSVAWRAAAIMLLAGATIAAGWVWVWPRINSAHAASRQPEDWRVENNALKVFNAQGEQLWEFRFKEAVDAPTYGAGSRTPSPPVKIVDLDGDGAPEVLALARSARLGGNTFYCFEASGAVRFSRNSENVSGAVRFGSEKFAPPFHPTRFLVTADSGQRKSVWLVSVHNLNFPAVVQKLTPQGRVAGEYWSNGHIHLVKDAVLGGRRVLLAGGMNNEHKTASLAVLDYENPSGSAPAVKDEYQCKGCPAGTPLAFLLFPQMEISREFDARPFVREIRIGDEDSFVITVLHAGHTFESDKVEVLADALYELDAEFHLRAANSGDGYRDAHNRLEMMGRLKHRFGARDEAELFSVLSWNGREFVKTTGRGTSVAVAQR
ncbi:MAG: hypothetical protein M1453_10490 [Acidobacteria bacterium]|nr:hypothetical protein [Acidobacteriota bacterium]MCL5288406.1 hypothetical protein [Acidobacteriota bacterium]